MKILLVVDMQVDFVTGSLGTKEAEAIVPKVVKKINEFSGEVIFTKDTHFEDYLSTQEGHNLPVSHCIKGTPGWELVEGIDTGKGRVLEKVTFGSKELGSLLTELAKKEKVEEITIIGLCTDICVISNAMIAKAFLPEAKIVVDSGCCAGVTPESHNTAISAMRACQIEVR